ncbi:hypothetical protein AB0B66_38445 [Catellatospora sp. NPDC049111]|uniref:hypothetical protein n=1 Tax=Catellatospora sp. NPDC049111 TaxID=3155271 RepID=UPI0033DBDE17
MATYADVVSTTALVAAVGTALIQFRQGMIDRRRIQITATMIRDATETEERTIYAFHVTNYSQVPVNLIDAGFEARRRRRGGAVGTAASMANNGPDSMVDGQLLPVVIKPQETLYWEVDRRWLTDRGFETWDWIVAYATSIQQPGFVGKAERDVRSVCGPMEPDVQTSSAGGRRPPKYVVLHRTLVSRVEFPNLDSARTQED